MDAANVKYLNSRHTHPLLTAAAVGNDTQRSPASKVLTVRSYRTHTKMQRCLLQSLPARCRYGLRDAAERVSHDSLSSIDQKHRM
jgi:hypothetical protein